MASLIISINDSKQGFELPAILGKVTVIGCDGSCDIVLSKVEGLSHRQCSITCTKEGFILRDLDSTNGTYANDEEIEGEHLMREGVFYAIGEASMILAELNPYNPVEAPVVQHEEKATPEEAEAKTAPIAEAESDHATAPLATEDSTATAPLQQDDTTATAPIATEEEAPAADKRPTHTRPLPGRKKARRAKLVAGGKERRPLTDEELQRKAQLLSGSFGGSGVSTLYVVIIILAAFYAGMSLYSWKTEGSPVPWFMR